MNCDICKEPFINGDRIVIVMKRVFHKYHDLDNEYKDVKYEEMEIKPFMEKLKNKVRKKLKKKHKCLDGCIHMYPVMKGIK